MSPIYQEGAEPILRIAAKGDGVTASGRHVPRGVSGDMVLPDGQLQHGPHHVDPPCRHFSHCGGCQLQHADEAALRQFVTERVTHAAASQDIAVEELLPTHLSPPRSRRRATLHGLRTAAGVVLGFREAGSHRIIDIAECPVMRQELFDLVAPLRKALATAAGKRPIDVALTLADQGADVVISGLELDGLAPTEAMLDFAREQNLARLSLDQGFGAEALWEPQPVTVSLSGVPVSLPPAAFLQPTRDGEQALVADARAFVGDAASVADLFAGLGTFAFAMPAETKVLAVEAARDAHLASLAAANRHERKVACLHRDLFRAPLQPDELNRFTAVILDPPRAGARDQIREIAASRLERVAYISCNASSWARDARTLVDAGFRLERLRPVGQFRWSTHVELTSLFVR